MICGRYIRGVLRILRFQTDGIPPPFPPNCPIPPILAPVCPILPTSRGFDAAVDAGTSPGPFPLETAQLVSSSLGKNVMIVYDEAGGTPLSIERLSFETGAGCTEVGWVPDRKALFSDMDLTATGFLGAAVFVAEPFSAVLPPGVDSGSVGLPALSSLICQVRKGQS